MSKYYKIVLEQIQPLHLWKWNFGIVAETDTKINPWQFLSAILNAKWMYKYSIDSCFDSIIENISIFEANDIKDFSDNHIKTYVSTAVVPWDRWSKDSSLHEIEYITNIVEWNNQNLHWTGYVNLSFEIDWLDFQSLKDSFVFVGWEQRYWFGKMNIKSVEVLDIKELGNKVKRLKHFSNQDLEEVKPVTLRLFNQTEWAWKEFIYKGLYGIPHS